MADIQTKHLQNMSKKKYHLMMFYPLPAILTAEYSAVQSMHPTI
jgi:hypothetical protein